MSKNTFVISPIGSVRVNRQGFLLALEKEYAPALKRLDGFSHLNVFWWCHLCDVGDGRTTLTCDQPYRKAPKTVGVFATRSPLRPNPIALTVAMILDVDHSAGVIRIPYIDAEHGTPIVDLKPYQPSCDRVRDVRVPQWCSHWPQWYEDSAQFNWQAEFVNAR